MNVADRRGRRWMHGRRAAAVITIVAVLLYAAVVALYALNDRSRDVGCVGSPPSDSVQIQLQPEAVDAAADRIAANFTVRSWGPLEDPATGLASDGVTIFISDTDGAPTHRTETAQIPTPISVRFITDGYIQRWPFDTHVAEFAVVALRGAEDDLRPVPVSLCGTPNVPGWTFASQIVAGSDDLVVDGTPVDVVRLTAHRAGATVAFGLVILALMVVMPALTLTVAVLAYRGRRKVEATLMSWMAAMLFATIPLRSFLPGSPPIGSWVDYLVVLWVLVALVIGLIVYVRAWLRWSPAAPPHPSSPFVPSRPSAAAGDPGGGDPRDRTDGDPGDPGDADAGDAGGDAGHAGDSAGGDAGGH